MSSVGSNSLEKVRQAVVLRSEILVPDMDINDLSRSCHCRWTRARKQLVGNVCTYKPALFVASFRKQMHVKSTDVI